MSQGYAILHNKTGVEETRLNGTLASGMKHDFDFGAEQPGDNEDITEGYKRGSLILNDDDELFICLDNSEGAAVWNEVTLTAVSPSS